MNFGFLGPKWPFRDAYVFFSKKFAETPVLQCFRVRAFWAKLSKKGNFGHSPKKKKN